MAAPTPGGLLLAAGSSVAALENTPFITLQLAFHPRLRPHMLHVIAFHQNLFWDLDSLPFPFQFYQNRFSSGSSIVEVHGGLCPAVRVFQLTMMTMVTPIHKLLFNLQCMYSYVMYYVRSILNRLSRNFVNTFSLDDKLSHVILNSTWWNSQNGGLVIFNELLQYGYQMKRLAENNSKRMKK